ncbi:MAG: hypothetical protein R2844_12440 [Caldilineales bacterium]
MKTRSFAFLMAVVLLLATASAALAHRPYFEEGDIPASAPWQIDDPTISTVVYATLDARADVDYYTFEGKTGQRILLEITIPQIAGQELFAPAMALMGPGLPAGQLPNRVDNTAGQGAVEIAPVTGPAETFYEPFSRTSYWERQSERVTLPEDGQYTVAIWHPRGEVGRYGFVIGDKERLGGDLLGLGSKMRSYWTPVPEPTEPLLSESGQTLQSPLRDAKPAGWRFSMACAEE